MYQAHMEPEYPKLNTWQLPGTTAWLIDYLRYFAVCLVSLFCIFRSSPAKMVANEYTLYVQNSLSFVIATALKCWELSVDKLIDIKGKIIFV